MKNIVANSRYFVSETGALIRQSLFSHGLSILSTFLVFFILAMAISGWRLSNHVADVIQGQAAINVFFEQNMDQSGFGRQVEKIKELPGVKEARLVDKSEAYGRMAQILGDQADVLELVEENPFSPFIEVNISLDDVERVVGELKQLTAIDHIQNNREVLDRLRIIAGALRLLGVLVVLAVGLATLVIISQIIRLGIENNREEINTLRLLGAPETFIACPFLLEGVLISGSGGLLAAVLAAAVLKYTYAQIAGQLSFIPLLPFNTVIRGTAAVVFLLSIILGTGGGLIGLTTAKSK